METTTLILTADRGANTPQIATQEAASPLRDAVRRALRRQEHRWVVLCLHLSRLPGAALRPHHRRIAKAVLNDAASRRDGQLFTLPNGDFVLLFPAPDGGTSVWTALADLFAADAPDAGLLLSRWLLPVDLDQLGAFLDAVPTIVATPAGVDPEAGLSSVAQLCNAIEPGRVRDLLERQTGVLVALSGANRVVPLYRELRVSTQALEARAAAAGHVTADPFLFRHLLAKIGRLMLDTSLGDLRDGSPMLAWAPRGRPMLHLNLDVQAVLSPIFDELHATAADIGARVAIEIALVDACADADAYLAARERIRAAKFGVILDDVSQHALAVIRPGALQPDLVKLDWSRQLPLAGPAFDHSLTAFGPAKVILQKADSEDALRWGIARGIRRFQGRHVDAILAAGRIAACSESALCTVRKCAERETATTASGRAGCQNLPLLDAGSPAQQHFA